MFCYDFIQAARPPEFMAETVTSDVPQIVNTTPVTYKMELVSDVNLDGRDLHVIKVC